MQQANSFIIPQMLCEPADWIIERDGIDQFRATPKRKDGEKVPTLVFRRDGLGWDLVDIEIPEGGLGSEKPAAE